MKIGTIGIVVAVSVTMISAALAYHFFIKQPAEAPVERSVAQNQNIDRSYKLNSGKAARSDKSDSLSSRSPKSNEKSGSGNETGKSEVRGVVKRSDESGRVKTERLARLSEDGAGTSENSQLKMNDNTGKLRDRVETPKSDDTSPVRRPKFDVIRVAPDGVSVFAGQAEPGASVVVILNGRRIGESVADSDGAWSVVTVITEHREDMELVLQVRKGSKLIAEIEKPVIVEKIIAAETAQTPAKSAILRSRPASKKAIEKSTVSLRAGKKKRVLDDKTVIKKIEEKDNKKLAIGPKIDPPKKTAEGKPIILETKQEGVIIASPVPINFVYREAIFTEDGKQAVAALLEFVMKKKLSKIVLSGHTDERGNEEFNMTLSEDRLVAVSTFLRSHGFTGDIVLRPMGEIRPMQIRNAEGYSQEDIWQFNRRVELEGSE